MATTFHVVALSSLDIEGIDVKDKPDLLYPEALNAARDLKAQGKAFRVIPGGECSEQEFLAFKDLGAVD